MGVYLSSPKTEKFSEDGENDRLRYGLSSMQGWRRTMEDASNVLVGSRSVDQKFFGSVPSCDVFWRHPPTVHAAYPDLDESTSFFAVYDGHGGKAVAKFCAKYLHQQVLKHEAYLAGDLGTSLQKSFLRMDEMMCGKRGRRELAVLGEKSKIFSSMRNWLIRTAKSGAVNGHVDDWDFEEGPHCGFRGPKAGCTACVAVIRDNHLLVANAGDSRCVLSRKGQAHDLTKDHKPDLEVEKYRILQAGGFIQCGRVNGSLNLTRAIGDIEFKENKHLPAEKQMVTADPELTSVELCNDDEFLVIACDGIWDCMSSQRLVDFIHDQLMTENDLKSVCEKVLDWCLAPAAGGLGCDNMTMILIQFKRPSNSSGSITSQQAPVI